MVCVFLISLALCLVAKKGRKYDSQSYVLVPLVPWKSLFFLLCLICLSQFCNISHIGIDFFVFFFINISFLNQIHLCTFLHILKTERLCAVCMIRYLSPASCQPMQISICSKLGLNQNGKILSVQMEANGLLPAAERVTLIPCG